MSRTLEDDVNFAACLCAVDLILKNLEGSDFKSEFGQAPIRHLAEYRVDMASDIFREAFHAKDAQIAAQVKRHMFLKRHGGSVG